MEENLWSSWTIICKIQVKFNQQDSISDIAGTLAVTSFLIKKSLFLVVSSNTLLNHAGHGHTQNLE